MRPPEEASNQLQAPLCVCVGGVDYPSLAAAAHGCPICRLHPILQLCAEMEAASFSGVELPSSLPGARLRYRVPEAGFQRCLAPCGMYDGFMEEITPHVCAP